MILEKKLMPDLTLESFRDLTPELLRALGASAVISDIDNTLAPYEDLDAPEDVISWVRALREAGIGLTLVSNNGWQRVERFNENLGCRAFAKVRKPSSKYLKKAMLEMGSAKDETVFLGDQLLTDSLAAHRAGIRAVIVPPIKDKKTLFFRIKRLIEKPYAEKYKALHTPDKEDIQ